MESKPRVFDIVLTSHARSSATDAKSSLSIRRFLVVDLDIVQESTVHEDVSGGFNSILYFSYAMLLIQY